MDYYTARKCFAENIQLFGNPQEAPEKFNLYNGLVNLAEAIEHDMSNIKDQIQYLHNLIQNIRR